MKLCDVNVLVYAHRPDSIPDAESYKNWLEKTVAAQSAFGISETMLSGFVRIVTNPRIFKDATPPEIAIEFCESLRRRENAVILSPQKRHWEIFSDLVTGLPAKGKLVADAWHAALAIEHDCTWISTDSDFVRFKGLRWEHPLKA